MFGLSVLPYFIDFYLYSLFIVGEFVFVEEIASTGHLIEVIVFDRSTLRLQFINKIQLRGINAIWNGGVVDGRDLVGTKLFLLWR